MVIKSISWKTPGFQEIIEYVTHELKAVGTPVMLNLPVADPTDIRAVRRAFQENAKHLPPRKNGTCLYHEILSFAPTDSERLSPAILSDLAGRYLELRAPEALGYATVHMDCNHPHIHFVISANLVRQAKKLRLSRTEFAGVKRAIEAYQKERYPELSRSLVQPEAGSKPKRLRSSRRQERGGGIPPEAITLKEELDEAFLVSFSADEFSRALQAAGIGLIREQGRITGVTAAGASYAFLQLGYPENTFSKAEAAWRLVAKRMRTIASDATEKTRAMLRRYGYADELMAVLDRTGRDRVPDVLRERLNAIERDTERRHLDYRRTHTGLGRRKDLSET